MVYTVEYIKFQDGSAEPVVVHRDRRLYETEGRAMAFAQASLAAAQTELGAIGYRIRDVDHVITTRVAGIDA